MRLSISLFYCLPLLLALLYHPAALSEGITFSEPHMVDTEIRYSQVGAPYPRASSEDCIGVAGPNSHLILYSQTFIDGLWSMVSTDLDGHLRDSVPVPLVAGLSCPVDRLFDVYGAVWSEPYFYIVGRPIIFTGLPSDSLCYVRVTEDLQVMDAAPIPFMPVETQYYLRYHANDSFLWVVYDNYRRYQNRIYMCDVRSDSMESVDEVLISEELDCLAESPSDDGLYIASRQDETFNQVGLLLAPDRELHVLDTVNMDLLEPVLFNSISVLPHNADSMLACFFEIDSTGLALFCYYYLTQNPDPEGTEFQTIEVPFLPGNRDETTAMFRYDQGMLTAMSEHQPYGEDDYAHYEFDLTSASLVLAEIIDGVRIPVKRCLCWADLGENSMVYYDDDESGIVTRTGFQIDDAIGTFENKQIVYAADNYYTPNIALDDEGLLMYAEFADTTGSSLKGFRIVDLQSLEPAASFDVLDESFKPHSPDIRIFGDKKIFFWLEDISEITTSYYNRQHQFIVMEGDLPSPAEIDNRDSLCSGWSSSHGDQILGAVQIGSLVYLDAVQKISYDWYLNWSRVYTRAIDLTTGRSTPFSLLHQTNGRTALTVCSDRLFSIVPWLNCDIHDNIACIKWSTGYNVNEIAGDEYIGLGSLSWSQYHDFEYLAFDISAWDVNGELILSARNPTKLMQLDPDTWTITTKGELNPFLASYYPAEPVSTHSFNVAITAIANPSRYKTVVFDHDWNFLDSAVIPMAGMPLDVSKFVALPDEDKIVFAYSSFVAGEYASPRLFLQSVTIDIETGVPPGNDGALPATFALHQPYPNPFNPDLSLALSIPTKAHLTVEVFNLLGQRVTTLHDAPVSAGEMQLDWNASEFSSGVYLIRAQYGDRTATVKAVLLK